MSELSNKVEGIIEAVRDEVLTFFTKDEAPSEDNIIQIQDPEVQDDNTQPPTPAEPQQEEAPGEEPPATGAHVSPYDYRRVPMSSVATATPNPASNIQDISALPVFNQKKLGACTGHAAAKYRQWLLWLDTKEIFALSPRHPYAIAKATDGITDQGTYPTLIAKSLLNNGIATEATIPNNTDLDHETYVYNRSLANIPADASADAAPFKIGGFASPNVQNPDELKTAINQFYGAMLLLEVGNEWWTNASGSTTWAAADIVPLRPPKSPVSGHEVFLYGYEDVNEGGRVRTKFYIFNSWSVQWGLLGKAWFYYDEYAPYLKESITFVDLPAAAVKNLSQLPSASAFKHNFTSDINLNDKGDEVVALQTALLIDGELPKDLYTKLLLAADGSELGFFGDATRRALLAFQTKYQVDAQPNIDVLAGKTCGPKTRAKLNALFNK